jgi:general secretion pathway protein K
VAVEVIPEAGKLNVNTASPLDLMRLLQTLGVDSSRAQQIATGIVEWRTFSQANSSPVLNVGPGSSFQPRRASLEELEEILLIPGMTPDILYGRYDHDPSGRLIPRGGLRDCLTVWGTSGKVDVNTAPGPLLESVGVPPESVQQILTRRPFGKIDEIASLVPDPAVMQRLGIAGNTIWTLRATARTRNADGSFSDLRKTVAAVVKLVDISQVGEPYHILRWYDDAWSPVAQVF